MSDGSPHNQPNQTQGAQKSLRSLPLPTPEEISEALLFFQARRKKRIFLTAVFKLKVNSKSKKEELLAAFLYTTKLTNRVFKAFEPSVKKNEKSESQKSTDTEQDNASTIIFELISSVFTEQSEAKATTTEQGDQKTDREDQKDTENVIVKRGKLLAEKIGQFFSNSSGGIFGGI